MPLDIIVLMKQVPDTRGEEIALLTEEGLVNRAALPAIVNPQDLYALKEALAIKDVLQEVRIRVLTMGPPSAADALREGLCRGADSAVLLTDPAFRGADTLATSYVLSQAVRKMGLPDFIFCGHQSLDGDTSHVAAQVAELLGMEHIGNAHSFASAQNAFIATQKRDEQLVAVPALKSTVVAFSKELGEDFVQNARQTLEMRNAATKAEQAQHPRLTQEQFDARPHLTIAQWDAKDIVADPQRIGLQGSPTRVLQTKAVTFAPKSSERYTDSDADLSKLVATLSSLI